MAQPTTPGLLLAMMDIPAEFETDFNRVYDHEHLPERLALDEVLGARRYKAVEATPYFQYQALYDLSPPEVFLGPKWQRLHELQNEWNTRISPHTTNRSSGRLPNLFRQIYPTEAPTQPGQVGGALLIGLQVPAERDEEFNDWYNTEHIPYLSQVPGVLRARRFAPVDGSKRYLAVYELSDPDIPLSDAWRKAANTPWTARMRRFMTPWLRIRCRALAPVA